MKPKHTPEPWRVGDAGLTVFGPPNGNPAPEIIANARGGTMGQSAVTRAFRVKANAARIVQCVNACAGIEDPAAALKVAREALRTIAQRCDEYGISSDTTEDARVFYRLRDYAQEQALALLGKGGA